MQIQEGFAFGLHRNPIEAVDADPKYIYLWIETMVVTRMLRITVYLLHPVNRRSERSSAMNQR